MRVEFHDTLGTWAALAASYLARGDGSVTAVAPGSGSDAVVTDGDHPGAGLWRLTDRAGETLPRSVWVRAAVAGADSSVIVQLRAGEQVLAEGRVDVRRSVAATCGVALTAAGPLIEMAVHASRPSRRAPSSQPGTAPGPRMTATRATARFAGRLARAALTYREWGVARLTDPLALDQLSAAPGRLPSGMEWSTSRPDRFWADPAAVAEGNQRWLFVEELDRRTGRGHIRALRWTGSRLEPGEIVLSTHHHHSFPQPVRVAGRWLATVETCATHNPIYTFDRLGEPWRPAGDLPPLPPRMADPVVEFGADGSPVRLLASDAATSPDAVFVEHRWDGENWVRDGSRTYVDVRTARGGGTWDRERGLRAVQDCAGVYGRGLSLVPAEGWYGLEPAPVHIDRDSLPDHRYLEGIHTLTWTGDQTDVWIDGWHRRFSLAGGWLRLVERRHLSRCDGG